MPISAGSPLIVTVAPLVGAWIEIADRHTWGQWHTWSLPSWERGLKLVKYLSDVENLNESLPSWERGLK